MRIYQLEGFYCVGKYGGFTKAAKAMPYPVGEPAVFQQVKTLQQDLGVKLVEKVKGAGIRLTPEGRTLHAFIAPFFEGLAMLERDLTAGTRGTLIIAAPRLLMLSRLLPNRLVKIRRLFPSICIRLVEEQDSLIITSKILSGEADFGLSYFPEIPAPLNKWLVGHFEAVAAMPRHLPMARRRSVSLADLTTYSLILYPQGTLPRLITDEVAKRQDIHLQIAMEATTSEAMTRYAENLQGIAIIPNIRGEIPFYASRKLRFPPIKGFDLQPIHLIARNAPPASLIQRVAALLAHP